MAERAGRRDGAAFFGRRRGKPLRQGQARALDAAAARYAVALDRPAPTVLAGLFDAPVREVRLEIGFGGGEHLLHEAARLEDVGFIGVEPFVNGMAKMAAALEAAPRGNLRLFDDDATLLLDWLPTGSLGRVDLLYPDPWPKRKHWKRRFVNPANLDRFARVLKRGGVFRFASDIDTYVDWTLLHCRAHPGFDWQARSADDWRRPWADWPGTRYEHKAVREGRRPAYLTFVRP